MTGKMRSGGVIVCEFMCMCVRDLDGLYVLGLNQRSANLRPE